MPVLDVLRCWKQYDERLRGTDGARQRAILDGVKDHLMWELLGNPAEVMATVCARPLYRFYGPDGTQEVAGVDAVKAWYQEQVDLGLNLFEVNMEHLAVQDWGLAGRGGWDQVFDAGIVPASVNIDRSQGDRRYLLSTPIAFFFLFDEDAKLVSELNYFSTPTLVREVAADETISDPLSRESFA